jgi:phospholipid/cholesterol/gamma-HCH transport system substrate-binding protein
VTAGGDTREAQPRDGGLVRMAAIAAVITACALAALLLFAGAGGGGYTVKARFINASQLVEGNHVDIGGTKAGLVEGFELTPDGQAEVELSIDDEYAPLRQGTRAVVRASGLTSPSGRYVQLMLPPEPEAGGDIPDGGLIDVDSTTTQVDLDQFFNIFDRRTRRALQDFYKGGQRQYAGRGDQANAGLKYLSPQLAASTRLFEELRHEPPVLERFLVDSSRFVTALAERREDLAALIGNLNSTTRALGSQKAALAEAVGLLPGFMRQANTTYVNLRSTLDELEPFVEASKPVAKRLGPYLDELRPFAREAVPTVRDASALIRSRGPANDVTELNRTYPPLVDIALTTKQRKVDFGTGPKDVGETRGAFAELTEALNDSAPIVAHGRPYTPDLFGWFDDFSHTGAYDALGSFSRVQTYFNAFTVSEGLPDRLLPLSDRAAAFREIAKLHQTKRCPGAAEEAASDGSNVWSEEEQAALDCRESDRATGPIE